MTGPSGLVEGVAVRLRRAARWLPAGDTLSRGVLVARHRYILVLLWLHVPGVTALAVLHEGHADLHSLWHSLPVAFFAGLASLRPFDRTSRAMTAASGLLTASAVVVHVSGGYIEAHFHFFVMLAVVALYQHWAPFLLAVGFVVLHHGVLSVLVPLTVYNHPAAQGQPFRWGLLHAAFVLAAATVHVVAWRSSEQGAHDSLTGTPGATLFVRRLEQTLDRTRACVVYFDLDGFKKVNDRLGHQAGDELLACVARRAESAVRLGDIVGRLGGDEFAVLLPGADVAEARRVADRLTEALTRPFELGAGTAHVGVSTGIAVSSTGVRAEQLLHSADVAMYEVKRAHKGASTARTPAPRVPADAQVPDRPVARREPSAPI